MQYAPDTSLKGNPAKGNLSRRVQTLRVETRKLLFKEQLLYMLGD